MRRDLFFAGQPTTAVVHGFYDDEAPTWLQPSSNVSKHRRVLGHLIICVVDHHGVELTGGKMRIVNGADDYLDIADGLTARAIAQFVQRGLADINSDDAAIRRDGMRDWNRKGALSGADVGYR